MSGGDLIGWLIKGLVAIIGFAHAVAAWVYFARQPNRVWWAWSAAWVFATASCIAAANSNPQLGYGLFVGLVVMWTAWWIAIRASAGREWVAENRYQATGTINGDLVTIRNVRNFSWLGKHEFIERWETRTYDLRQLQAVDLFVCTWGVPGIAHVMVSFAFADRHPLCVSVETRREVGERWTPFAGFMKSYELLIIAGDEQDLVKSRINIRNEDVRLYRLRSSDEMRRKILRLTIAQMNGIATRPIFYNTIFHNCTIEIARIVWAAGRRFPLDWRILVSGHVTEYLYERRLLDRSMPFEALKANADISKRSQAADADPDYSARIREGIADPAHPKAIDKEGVRPGVSPLKTR